MSTRISIHDMNRIKLCEIFDSELKPEGQAYDVSLTTEISGCSRYARKIGPVCASQVSI